MYETDIKYFVHMQPKAHIAIEQVTPEGKGAKRLTNSGTYPRIIIGEVTIFPSVEQLVAIHDAFERYWAAHPPPAKAEVADEIASA